MAYTRQSTNEALEAALREPDTLYTKGLVKRKGKTSDSDEFYTEVIAEYLLRGEPLSMYLGKIKPNTRRASYRVEGHERGSSGQQRGRTNRYEEVFAKSLRTIHNLGHVIDYQVPLKNRRSDKGVGKIDLIVAGQDAIWLTELKLWNESETLLRCALEIATYALQLDQAKFREDFKNQLKEFRVSPSAHFENAVLFDRSCLACKEFMDLPQRPKLEQLLEKLKVTPFYFDLPVIESVSVQPPSTPTGCP